jgi:hypothetical protein
MHSSVCWPTLALIAVTAAGAVAGLSLSGQSMVYVAVYGAQWSVSSGPVSAMTASQLLSIVRAALRDSVD